MPRAVLGAIACLVIAAACNLPRAGPAPTDPVPSSTSLPTATTTPAPTPAPSARNEAARQALSNGDWELAEREFERVIAEGVEPKVVGEALYGRAESLLRAENLSEAIVALTEFLSSYPNHPRIPDAHILRAQASNMTGDAITAIADYEAYLAARPAVIDLYVHEWLGDSLRLAARPLEAVPHYEEAMLAPGQVNMLRLRVKIGRAYLEAGEFDRALEQFDRVYELSEDPATRASMNLLAGEIYERLGDLDNMHVRLLDSFENYPTAFDSYVGLVRLVQDGVPVDEFQRGFVDYHAAAYEPALAAFSRYLETTPSASGYYYRGLTNLALGNALLALQDFDWVTANYPSDPIWPDAMFSKARTEWAWLDRYTAAVNTYLDLSAAHPEPNVAVEALVAAARTAERSHDLQRAAEIWLRVANEYPGSISAAESAFQAGLAQYRSDEYAASEQTFESALNLATTSAERARANLWIGKARLAGGEADAAREAWLEAARSDPTGYYSERAEHLLEGVQPFETAGTFHFSTDLDAEKLVAEQWLSETFGVASSEPLSELDDSLLSDPRFIRGAELWNLGLLDEARAELSSLRRALETDPVGTYRLMHTLLGLGLFREAIFASRQILNQAGMDDAATLTAPVYFNRIRFGPYYGDLILPEAARYGLDGLFLLSVVRQESLFEGFATSSASARGLMQVIPSTGESIAGQLGWPIDYETGDLYRPLVSVRFGTYYLDQQRNRFDGDLYAALAAYNAGPGNSIIWKDLAPDDPDLFLEIIRLAEPKRYIQVIYEVYEIYKDLYSQ